MALHFPRAYSDVVKKTCIPPFKSEEAFLKAPQHNTPKVLLDRIVSDASSQTRPQLGNGTIPARCRLQVGFCWKRGLWMLGIEVSTSRGGAMHLGGYISGLAGKKSSFILT